MWAAVDGLVDRAPTVLDLLDHRLGAIAARRWRAAGRALPAPILEEERYASVATLATPVLLGRVASVYDGPTLVLKGPEVAARFPDPVMRPSHDLDVLVEDSAAAFAALRDAGCSIIRDDPAEQHELPLVFPDLPLSIEVHSAPKWPARAAAAPTAELFAHAVPSSSGVPGMLAPSPAHQAVLLAVHSWTHRPLARALDLVDVLVTLDEADEAAAEAIARRWKVDRIWSTTVRAARALLAGDRPPWPLRTWARNTPAVRRPTRGEELLERCVSPFAALPPLAAARASTASIAQMVKARASGGHASRANELRPEHPAFIAARERESAERRV